MEHSFAKYTILNIKDWDAFQRAMKFLKGAKDENN